MRRFYNLSVQPNLFGGHSLMRNWGRIGTDGRSKIQFFDSELDAQLAQAAILNVKVRRGYLIV